LLLESNMTHTVTADDDTAETTLGTKRIRLFNAPIDVVTMQQAIDVLRNWLDETPEVCRFVVTPNVDHAVILQHHEGLQNVYADAHLVLADGLPLILASRWLGKPLPERVAGSELVPRLLSSVPTERQLRCFLLGAGPGVADRAADRIRATCPGIAVVGTYSPPLGFEKDPTEEQRILQLLRNASPELLIVGLGAPKQELWVHRHFRQLPAKVALCVGASIDFIAGEKKQAPVWMRRSGLEWLHRMMSEPKRLAKRYAHDAWVFPQLVWRDWRAGR
jgi:N-acetylglucosaminyldiphosphoundecaprenol N-acetyl-beta-D-mannosaminyltransferase